MSGAGFFVDAELAGNLRAAFDGFVTEYDGAGKSSFPLFGRSWVTSAGWDLSGHHAAQTKLFKNLQNALNSVSSESSNLGSEFFRVLAAVVLVEKLHQEITGAGVGSGTSFAPAYQKLAAAFRANLASVQEAVENLKREINAKLTDDDVRLAISSPDSPVLGFSKLFKVLEEVCWTPEVQASFGIASTTVVSVSDPVATTADGLTLDLKLALMRRADVFLGSVEIPRQAIDLYFLALNEPLFLQALSSVMALRSSRLPSPKKSGFSLEVVEETGMPSVITKVSLSARSARRGSLPALKDLEIPESTVSYYESIPSLLALADALADSRPALADAVPLQQLVLRANLPGIKESIEADSDDEQIPDLVPAGDIAISAPANTPANSPVSPVVPAAVTAMAVSEAQKPRAPRPTLQTATVMLLAAEKALADKAAKKAAASGKTTTVMSKAEKKEQEVYVARYMPERVAKLIKEGTKKINATALAEHELKREFEGLLRRRHASVVTPS